MSNKDTSGPAFPTEVWGTDGCPEHTEGMTLRDYFAAKAMQGFCAGLQAQDNIEALPALAYSMADAMIKAREY